MPNPASAFADKPLAASQNPQQPVDRSGVAAFADGRSAAAAQRAMQQIADSSPQARRLSGVQRLVDGGTQRRAADGTAQLLKIKGSSVKVNTFDAFRDKRTSRDGKEVKYSDLYQQLLDKFAPQADGGRDEAMVKRMDYHLGNMISDQSQLAEFENEDHFIEALAFDIEHVGGPDEKHTLYERYMTPRGWNKRLHAAAGDGKGKPPAGDSKDKPAGKHGKKKQATPAASAGADAAEEPALDDSALHVYKAMSLDDLPKFDKWWTQAPDQKEGQGKNRKGAADEKDALLPIDGHLGDFRQALRYFSRDKSRSMVLLRFNMKPNAHRDMFSSAHMVFQKGASPKSVPGNIRAALVKEGDQGQFREGSKNEGSAEDKIGIKSELKGNAFSLAIGGGSSPTLFRSFIQDYTVVKKRVVGKPAQQEVAAAEHKQAAPSGEVAPAHAMPAAVAADPAPPYLPASQRDDYADLYGDEPEDEPDVGNAPGHGGGDLYDAFADELGDRS